MEIELLNIDCMEYMAGCKDKEFDLAIVDPPYGINQGGDKNYTRDKLAIAKNYKSFNDTSSPNKTYFSELVRISKNTIIFGANHFISKIPLDSSCWIVWDKDNGNNDFADCELAWTSFKSAARIYKYRWNGMLQEKSHNKEIRIHPTQKPIDLYYWILTKYAQPKQKIIDTHLGSGSSAIAAHRFGCDFVGCEIDKDYYDAALKRFEIETAQMDLF